MSPVFCRVKKKETYNTESVRVLITNRAQHREHLFTQSQWLCQQIAICHTLSESMKAGPELSGNKWVRRRRKERQRESKMLFCFCWGCNWKARNLMGLHNALRPNLKDYFRTGSLQAKSCISFLLASVRMHPRRPRTTEAVEMAFST